MNALHKAEAAARAGLRDGNDHHALLCDLLAALDAARGEAVAWYRPSEEGYDSAFRDVATVANCDGHDWVGWKPLYAAPPAALAVPAEPIGWVFQHEDTGRMTFCANDGINTPEVFQRLNPRHVLCGAAYTQAQQPAAAVPATMADGWRHDICATLNRVMPSWIAAGKTPIEAACNAIEALAAVACEAHDRPAAAVPPGYALVQLSDLDAIASTGYGRMGWTPEAERAAKNIHAMLAAAERKGVGNE